MKAARSPKAPATPPLVSRNFHTSSDRVPIPSAKPNTSTTATHSSRVIQVSNWSVRQEVRTDPTVPINMRAMYRRRTLYYPSHGQGPTLRSVRTATCMAVTPPFALLLKWVDMMSTDTTSQISDCSVSQ